MLELNQRDWIQSPAPKPLGQSSIVWCPQRDSNPQHTVSKTASSASWDTGAYSLFMSGAPPEIRTQTFGGFKAPASALFGLEGLCIWRRVKESNPCRLSPAAGGSSPVCTHCSHTPLNLKILEDRTWDFYPCRTIASFRVHPSRDPSRLCSVLLRSDLIIYY